MECFLSTTCIVVYLATPNPQSHNIVFPVYGIKAISLSLMSYDKKYTHTRSYTYKIVYIQDRTHTRSYTYNHYEVLYGRLASVYDRKYILIKLL